ncbi:hypothetical protein RHSIM_Rhsim12G0101800 [Rhododendron simsii]|uniref:Integrase catalytic domain-containing protein n=1 Tax=Rhododendron simsii TaxID=118357 RepID=A0A834L703_RHOSS|nr:hypothetical protein RHSIM_Rhsim12G0101800 [Rhododendron simsii]
MAENLLNTGPILAEGDGSSTQGGDATMEVLQAVRDGQNQMIAAMTALTEAITAALPRAPVIPPAVPPVAPQQPAAGVVPDPAAAAAANPANPVQNPQNPQIGGPAPVTGTGSVHQQPLQAENNGQHGIDADETKIRSIAEMPAPHSQRSLKRFLGKVSYLRRFIPALAEITAPFSATEISTKWVEAVSLRRATGAAVANFIKENIICRFGIPKVILSDNGTPFINKNVKKLLKSYSVSHLTSTPYYPQGNGQAEATNKTLIRIISKLLDEKGGTWADHLAVALWAYRTSHRKATRASPFSLVYEAETVLPAELSGPSARQALAAEAYYA